MADGKAACYPREQRWRYRRRRGGTEVVSALELWWELDFDAITDDYTPEEIGAVELWHTWVSQIRDRSSYDSQLGVPWVPIWWFVQDAEARLFERAPFARPSHEDFLSHFTGPVAADSGEAINWLRLPVVDRLWRPGRADKGGFIQEASGWKPHALQRAVELTLFEAAGLPTS